MILNTKEQREAKLFDYVQTLLEIENKEDLRILEVFDSPMGFNVDCEVFVNDNWRFTRLTVSVAKILLMEFTK